MTFSETEFCIGNLLFHPTFLLYFDSSLGKESHGKRRDGKTKKTSELSWERDIPYFVCFSWMGNGKAQYLCIRSAFFFFFFLFFFSFCVVEIFPPLGIPLCRL